MIEQQAPVPVGNPLIVIGGAEDKEREKTILRAFHQYAGAEQARILIIPTASSMPEILAEVYRLLFEQMGADWVRILNVSSRLEAQSPWVVDLVALSTGIFMTGGDQLRLANLLADTDMARKMQEEWQTGRLVIAGTSAGASAMGDSMISRGYSGESPKREMVELSVGLGILNNVIIDQHFHNRNRLPRLMTAIASRPYCTGIGIDENTAIILQRDGLLEVIGQGTVTIVDGSELTYNNVVDIPAHHPLSATNFRIHVMAQGLRYHLRERKLL
ncbi:MAG: cyanophycinase [Gemmatimonadaceae bacterium]|nr:cyanophycinase [Gloeobacterales cyanobacterium ES-bin-141]